MHYRHSCGRNNERASILHYFLVPLSTRHHHPFIFYFFAQKRDTIYKIANRFELLRTFNRFGSNRVPAENGSGCGLCCGQQSPYTSTKCGEKKKQRRNELKKSSQKHLVFYAAHQQMRHLQCFLCYSHQMKKKNWNIITANE